MLLTVFYIAATWMQAWRLRSIRRKIVQFSTEQTSFVLYQLARENYEDSIPCSAISSSFCKNKDAAKVAELLWDDANIRACTLVPKQVVNVNKWISFVDEESAFPIVLSRNLPVLQEPRLFILVEAIGLEQASVAPRCDINRIGLPKAWRADNTFGLVLESDIDHLAELSSSFMSTTLSLDEGLEVFKIQTVDVKGRPCLVMNTNRIPVTRSPARTISLDSPSVSEPEWPRRFSLCMSPTQWMAHMELLRSFSRCASETSEMAPIVVPEHRSACLMWGSRAVSDNAPTVIDIPESKESTPESALPSSETKETFESIPVTPEIKEILRGNPVLNGPSPVKDEVLTVVRQPVQSASSSCSSTPALLLSTTRGEGFVLSTPPSRSEASSCSSTPARVLPNSRKNTFASISSLGSLTSGSTASLRSGNSVKIKPPNVLVYSDSPLTTENVKAVLNETLHRHKYTIYSVSKEQLACSTWAVNCSLLVVCGNVPESVEPVLVNYLLAGGRLFCLCSAFLHSLLPTFRTAEVRERELVRFSYAKWSRVRLMHHVFCYQNSPARTKFSREADEPPNEKDRVSPVPITPATVQVLDREGHTHTLHVQVLGKEETWQTPSLLLAYFPSPKGRVVFSQVHLELDPSEISEEREGEALRSSDSARREIIRDILTTHLGLECASSDANTAHQYTVAYFLGRHELKLAFLEKIRGSERLGSMPVKFCGKGETPPTATSSLLPILIHSCPQDFSTLEYFETLNTESLGRLLIYCEVMGSSMDLVAGDLAHGLTVVPSHQTAGKGRSSNQWLSPPGCVMFSQQLHFPHDSYLGRHPSILQHATAVAIVAALSEISPQCSQALDLRLKWPNDIYTGDMVKVGGVLATCSVSGSIVTCNIGCGINLDNDSPTTCLNSQIKEYNKAFNLKIPKLSREKLLAYTFNRLELILDRMQEGDVPYLHDLYYTYWLHGDAQVNVLGPSGDSRPVVICGIDEFGYLRVREQTGRIFSVQPDGNSFDMMEGLIIPKLF